jgi:signal transduction histidine kinase
MEPRINPAYQEPGPPCLWTKTPLNSWQMRLRQMSTETKPANSSEHHVSGAEERLRLALVAGKMGIWELDLSEPNRIILSPELREILGLEQGNLDQSIPGFLSCVHGSDRVGVIRAITKAIRHQADPEFEFRFLRRESNPVWLFGRGRVYSNQHGPVRLVGVGIDITAQKLDELEILRLNAELERRVAERTAQLQATNKELEAFCYSVSHDLRAPLRSIRGFNEVLLERYGSKLDAHGQEFLRRACESSHYMDDLIDDLLKLSRVGRTDMLHRQVNLSHLAGTVAGELQETEPSRKVEFRIAPGLGACGDERLLRIVLDNLLRNSWKFTAKRDQARIEFGSRPGDETTFFVRDNGAGFDPAFAGRLFGVFQRLHSTNEFAGTGVGLATVQRIISRHGGRVWAEGAVDRGATFYFSLPPHETI